MAIDTRNKRASCLAIGAVFCLTLPLADGTVDQADRQQTAYCYAGLAAGALNLKLISLTLPSRSASLTLGSRSASLTLEDRD